MSVRINGTIRTNDDVDAFCNGYFNDGRSTHRIALEVFRGFQDFVICSNGSNELGATEEKPLKIQDIAVATYFLERMQAYSMSDSVVALTVHHQMISSIGTQFPYATHHVSEVEIRQVEGAIASNYSGCFGEVTAGERIPTHKCDFSTLLGQARMIRNTVTVARPLPPPPADSPRRTGLARIRHALCHPLRAAYHKLRPNHDR